MATSAGRKGFDHFAVDRDSAESFAISWDVVELASMHNSSKGKVGISDHHPIEMKVKELPTVVR